MLQELIEMTVEALYWRKCYDDANPEVGMGMSLETLLDQILANTGITPKESFKKAVLLDFNRRYNKQAY